VPHWVGKGLPGDGSNIGLKRSTDLSSGMTFLPSTGPADFITGNRPQTRHFCFLEAVRRSTGSLLAFRALTAPFHRTEGNVRGACPSQFFCSLCKRQSYLSGTSIERKDARALSPHFLRDNRLFRRTPRGAIPLRAMIRRGASRAKPSPLNFPGGFTKGVDYLRGRPNARRNSMKTSSVIPSPSTNSG